MLAASNSGGPSGRDIHSVLLRVVPTTESPRLSLVLRLSWKVAVAERPVPPPMRLAFAGPDAVVVDGLAIRAGTVPARDDDGLANVVSPQLLGQVVGVGVAEIAEQ